MVFTHTLNAEIGRRTYRILTIDGDIKTEIRFRNRRGSHSWFPIAGDAAEQITQTGKDIQKACEALETIFG